MQVNLTAISEEALQYNARLHEAEAKNLSLQHELDQRSAVAMPPVIDAAVQQSASDARNQLSAKCDTLEVRNAALEQQLRDLQQKMLPKDDLIAQLHAELKMDRENLECVQAIYTSTADLLERANGKCAALEMEKRQTDNRLADKEEKIMELESLTAMLTKQIAEETKARTTAMDESNLLITELHTEVMALKTKENEKIERFQAELSEVTEHLNATNVQVAQLQAANTGLENVLLKSSETITEMRDEGNLLREQLELYRVDFEAEKKSRLDIQEEREEILSDLKLLQRRNQQLIEEANKR